MMYLFYIHNNLHYIYKIYIFNENIYFYVFGIKIILVAIKVKMLIGSMIKYHKIALSSVTRNMEIISYITVRIRLVL